MTAYEMRSSDWSSNVCSSDLERVCTGLDAVGEVFVVASAKGDPSRRCHGGRAQRCAVAGLAAADRQSVVQGKSVSVRVDLGGRRIIQQKNTDTYMTHTTT